MITNASNKNAAAILGALSWKARSKGKTKKEISETMRQLANKRHAQRRLDKRSQTTPSV